LTVQGTLRRFLSGSIFSLAGAVGIQGSTLICNLLVSRSLGAAVYGKFGTVTSTLNAVAVIIQFAGGYTATKFVAQYRSADRERASRILGLCAILGGITLVVGLPVYIYFAHWVSHGLLRSPELNGVLVATTPFLALSAASSFFGGVLSGLEAFAANARATVAAGIISVVLVGVGIKGWGLGGALGGMVCGLGLRTLLLWISSRQHMEENRLSYRFSGAMRELRPILDFAIPAWIPGLLLLPSGWLVNAMLVRTEGGFREAAMYTAGNTLRLLVLFVPNVLLSVSVPVMNNLLEREGSSEWKRLRLSALGMSTGVGVAGVALVLCFRQEVVRLFGHEFIAAAPCVLPLLASVIPESIFLGLYAEVQARGKMWLSLFAMILPWQGTFLIGSYLLVPEHGALGAGVAYLLGAVILAASTVLTVGLSRSVKNATALEICPAPAATD
jgi:O-antigen/teichoic acid export membrane protein